MGGLGFVESALELFGGIWVFDAAGGDVIAGPLTGHEDEVFALAYSPDGSKLVSSDFGGRVLMWDLATGGTTVLLGPDTQARSVGPVAFHPDGATVVVGGYDRDSHELYASEGLLAGTIWVFDAATGEMLAAVPTFLDEVLGMAYSPDGEFLAAVSFDGRLSLWAGDLSGGGGSTQVSGSGAFGNAVSFSPDGRLLATANSDGTVSIFDGDTGNLIQDSVNAHRGGAFAVAFAGGVLFSGGADSGIRRYDLDNGQSIGRKALEQPIGSWSGFVADGSQIASLDFETIRLWDVGTGDAVAEPIVVDETVFVHTIAISPDGRLVAGVNLHDDGSVTVVLWDTVTGDVVGEPLAVADDVEWAAFSTDGTHLAAAGSLSGSLEIWDLRLGPAQVSQIESGDVGSWLGFSPDGSLVASTDFEGSVRFWDVEAGSQVGPALTGHDSQVNAVAFHPDGEIVATGSNDKTIRLWDLESGEQIGEALFGHGGAVLDAVFSPDGDLLVSSSQDTTVMFRRMSDLENPVTLVGHRAGVSRLSFIGDGAAVVSADDSGTVRLWPTPRFWQSLACRVAGRNLTMKEWTDIVGTERAYERQCAELPAGAGAPTDAAVVTVEY